jgi:hypothetical protein
VVSATIAVNSDIKLVIARRIDLVPLHTPVAVEAEAAAPKDHLDRQEDQEVRKKVEAEARVEAEVEAQRERVDPGA